MKPKLLATPTRTRATSHSNRMAAQNGAEDALPAPRQVNSHARKDPLAHADAVAHQRDRSKVADAGVSSAARGCAS
jgi:hypothetical protein